MRDFIKTEAATDRAYLVGLITPDVTEQEVNEYLDELAFLAHTAKIQAVESFTQRLDHPNGATFIGSGKLQEIADKIEADEIGTVIFDDELSPNQMRNIEKQLNVRVLDRTSLILDIFASQDVRHTPRRRWSWLSTITCYLV